MKKILYVLFIILLWNLNSNATTYDAASCENKAGQFDVQTAVNLATYGDIVTVPSGSCTWTASLSMVKNITLQGAGINQTIIHGKLRQIYSVPNSTSLSSHATFTVNGFTFDGDGASSSQLSSMGLVTFAPGGSNYMNLVVMNNKFINTRGSGVYLFGPVWGVVSTNQFVNVGMPIRNFGGSWAIFPQAYSTLDTMYFEDNTISFSVSTGDPAGWLETGQGASIVVRYNTWDETNATPGDFWDVHGLQNGLPDDTGCTAQSTRMAEYYGNKIIHNTTTYRWGLIRGGWNMIFNNYTDRSTTTSIQWSEYFCDSCGGAYVQHFTNSYLWGNYGGASVKNAVYQSPGNFPAPTYCPSEVLENRDYFNYNASCTSSSCSSGVGCGSATPSGTCTTGVGYWKTDQSCSDFTGMIGVNPATPISGTLYKCTDTDTWTAYYTPYTYPHPLSGANPPTHVITASFEGNGSMSPSGAMTVGNADIVGFHLTPDHAYKVLSVTGTCGGTLTGNDFVSSVGSSDCTVIANFTYDNTFKIVVGTSNAINVLNGYNTIHVNP